VLAAVGIIVEMPKRQIGDEAVLISDGRGGRRSFNVVVAASVPKPNVEQPT
jgi:hypothetical protein